MITLANLLWTLGTATALGLAAALAEHRGRPRLSHALWLAVLLRLVLLPCLPLPVLPGQGTPDTGAPVSSLAAVGDSARPAERAQPAGPSPPPGPRRAAPSPLPAVPEAPEPRAPEPTSGWTWLWAGWGAGTALLLVLGLARGLALGRRLRSSRSAGPELEALARRAASQVGLDQAPPVRLVDGLLPPVVFAFLRRPVIVLPADLLARLDPDEQLAILTHECAHVARRDHWSRYLEWLATALWWWLPLTLWVRRALRRTEERCCDAWVLSSSEVDPRAYASGLLRTVTWLADHRVPAPQTAVPLGGTADLGRRIDRIMNEPSTQRPRVVWHALAALGLVLLVRPVSAGSDGPDLRAALMRLNAAMERYAQAASPQTRRQADRDLENRLNALTRRIDRALQRGHDPFGDPAASDPLRSEPAADPFGRYPEAGAGAGEPPARNPFEPGSPEGDFFRYSDSDPLGGEPAVDPWGGEPEAGSSPWQDPTAALHGLGYLTPEAAEERLEIFDVRDLLDHGRVKGPDFVRLVEDNLLPMGRVDEKNGALIVHGTSDDLDRTRDFIDDLRRAVDSYDDLLPPSEPEWRAIDPAAGDAEDPFSAGPRESAGRQPVEERLLKEVMQLSDRLHALEDRIGRLEKSEGKDW